MSIPGLQESGVGDKLVLRNVLRLLGLPRAAARPKRAIQFGSRIGKLANRRDFGSNRAANAHNAGSVRLADVPAALSGTGWPDSPAAQVHSPG